MTLQELAEILRSTGLPVAYRAFPAGQAPFLPFICYLCTTSNNFDADDQVYFPVQQINVELYTAEKQPDVEALVETALSGLCWEKSEEYLDDERCYEIIYEIEV